MTLPMSPFHPIPTRITTCILFPGLLLADVYFRSFFDYLDAQITQYPSFKLTVKKYDNVSTPLE
jgi:hypothetical protein